MNSVLAMLKEVCTAARGAAVLYLVILFRKLYEDDIIKI